MKRLAVIALILSIIPSPLPCHGGNQPQNTQPSIPHASPDAIQQWRDYGFEIFVHWSAGTVFQGRYDGMELHKDLWGEWIMKRAGINPAIYKEALKTWDPKDFNADEWADTLKASGAKIVIYISKHHDGFAHFKSSASKYNTYDWGKFHTDVFGKLCEALKKRGMKTGFYYSHGTDWVNNPGGKKRKGAKKSMDNYFQNIVYPHLKELTTKYGRQDVAWFDLGAPKTFAAECVKTVRTANPDIIISSRVGGGLGDFNTGGDCYVPPTPQNTPWETCMTFNYHWAWYPEDRKCKTPRDIIQMLARIRSRGGNLLLNIGPDVRGKIPFQEKNCLYKVGAWLKLNGASIYAAKSTPYADLPWGVCTMKPGKLFLHLLRLPTLDYVFVPGIKSKITKAYILADPKRTPLKVEKCEFGDKVYLYNANTKFIDYRDTVVVLEYQDALNVDNTPVLDNDFDTTFIPATVRNSGGVHAAGTRINNVYDHGGVQEPTHIFYGYGYGNKGAKSSWVFHCAKDNYFYINIRYANLTSQTIKATVEIGGQKQELALPPTICPQEGSNPKKPSLSQDAFRLKLAGPVAIKKGANQLITFQVEDSSKSTDMDMKRGARKGFKASFMLQAIALKPAYPPPYVGYGDDSHMTKIK